MIHPTIVALFLAIARVHCVSLPDRIVDLFLFKSEPWRKLPVPLTDVKAEWTAGSNTGHLNCTEGSGSNLRNISRNGPASKKHLQDMSYVTARLALNEFSYKYTQCEMEGERTNAWQATGHIKKAQINISLLVEDNLDGCRVIVDTIVLNSLENALDPTRDLVQSPGRQKVEEAVQSSLMEGVKKALVSLARRKFGIPRHCGTV